MENRVAELERKLAEIEHTQRLSANSSTASLATSHRSVPAIDPKQRYDLRETALYLRLGRTKLFYKIAAGEIRTIIDGGRRFVPGTEIMRLSNPL